MQYPLHLLPEQNNVIIHFEEWLKPCHLLRHTPDGDLTDPETGLLKLDYIVVNTDHLRDFSTNLLGTFTPADCCWSVVGRKDYYDAAWQTGEEVKCPSPEEIQHHAHRSAFYLKIEDVAGEEIESKGEDEIRLFCHVLHTPMRCNYWHFSLRWKNADGEDSMEIKGNSIKRLLKAYVKEFIKRKARLDAPAFQSIPPEKYQLA